MKTKCVLLSFAVVFMPLFMAFPVQVSAQPVLTAYSPYAATVHDGPGNTFQENAIVVYEPSSSDVYVSEQGANYLNVTSGAIDCMYLQAIGSGNQLVSYYSIGHITPSNSPASAYEYPGINLPWINGNHTTYEVRFTQQPCSGNPFSTGGWNASLTYPGQTSNWHWTPSSGV